MLAHEVAHIANGDMVTMTLLQGVMNAFVMFLARRHRLRVRHARRLARRQRRRRCYFLIVIVLQIVLGILGSTDHRAGSRGSASSGPTTAAPRSPAASA